MLWFSKRCVFSNENNRLLLVFFEELTMLIDFYLALKTL